MLNQQKKKLRSNEKDYFFRKTSPRNKLNNTFQQKNNNRTFQISFEGSKQSLQNQSRNRQFSFLRNLPATTKNFYHKQSQTNTDIKEIKMPSFFKKSNRNKQTEQNVYNTQVCKQNNDFNNNFYNQDRKNSISLHQSAKSNNQAQNSSASSLQLFEYKKLNDKINYLQNKINGMKQTLNKKRQEKLAFMESQKNQRSSIFTDQEASTCSSSQTPLRKFVTQVPQHKDLHAFTHNPYSPRNSLYYVSQILRAYKQQKSLARQHVISSIEYLKMFFSTKTPDQKLIQHLKVNLPRPKGYEDKKTVIFDLDQTLIHCNQNVYMPSDIKIKIKFPTGEVIQVGINIRPYAKQILAALSHKFQIIVFTASHSCYANVVLDHLDPQKKYIHHRLFRQNCYCTPQGVYVKDLRILNRNLSKVLLVDNAAYSYAYQPSNGIPIIPYYQGKNDYQLPALQKYIESLIFSYDVREKNKNIFKLHRYPQFDDLNKLVQTLYKI